MLLWLTQWLSHFYHGFSVFQYITLRAILGALTALLVALFLGPALIRHLSSYRVGQVVRSDGPQSHLKKTGTPTMGGSLILIALTISVLLWGDLSNRYVLIALVTTLLFGGIGFVDDYKKIKRKSSDGLSAREKYFWQSVFALGIGFVLYKTADSANDMRLVIPFFKDVLIYLGPLYLVLTYFVIVGTSN